MQVKVQYTDPATGNNSYCDLTLTRESGEKLFGMSAAVIKADVDMTQVAIDQVMHKTFYMGIKKMKSSIGQDKYILMSVRPVDQASTSKSIAAAPVKKRRLCMAFV